MYFLQKPNSCQKAKPKKTRKEKKEKSRVGGWKCHHRIARTRHTGKMSSQSVQTFGRKYVYTISSWIESNRSRCILSFANGGETTFSRASFHFYHAERLPPYIDGKRWKGRCAREFVSFQTHTRPSHSNYELTIARFLFFSTRLPPQTNKQKNCRCRRARQTRERSLALEWVAHRAREDGITQN